VKPDGLGLGWDGKADATHKDTRHTRIYPQATAPQGEQKLEGQGKQAAYKTLPPHR